MKNLPTYTLQNLHLQLEVLSTGGPRLVGLHLSGSQENLLAEAPDIVWQTPHGPYYMLGGHRLWVAPESPDYTAIPDDHGLGFTQVGDVPGLGVRLTQPPDPVTQIERSIEVRLDPDKPALTLVHVLTNTGSRSFTCAAWGITQLRMGGIALLPSTTNPVDAYGLLPNRNLVLWPYTRLDDPRLKITPLGCLLYGSPLPYACKIGTFSHLGWLGYFLKNCLFIKYFTPSPDLVHTDQHCNAEMYVKDSFIELESLSPIATLQPGANLTHVERWEVHRLPTPIDPTAKPDYLFELANSFLS
jgi:hypothetical protein